MRTPFSARSPIYARNLRDTTLVGNRASLVILVDSIVWKGVSLETQTAARDEWLQLWKSANQNQLSSVSIQINSQYVIDNTPVSVSGAVYDPLADTPNERRGDKYTILSPIPSSEFNQTFGEFFVMSNSDGSCGLKVPMSPTSPVYLVGIKVLGKQDSQNWGIEFPSMDDDTINLLKSVLR